MGHIKDYKIETAAPDGRALGDEWADWDGKGGTTVREGKRLFIAIAAAVVAAMGAAALIAAYMISPRLAQFDSYLPYVAWALAAAFALASAGSVAALAATAASGRDLIPSRRALGWLIDLVFPKAFRLAQALGISRDRIGHSFVLVHNALERSKCRSRPNERLLVLLPRCLSKEEIQKVTRLKEIYPMEIHTVSGGELARRKVKELKPTAVIGVACERDLVSGIRDVAGKLSVIGIPNQRPEGPCKNTHIDMDELVRAIEFYVGPPGRGGSG